MATQTKQQKLLGDYNNLRQAFDTQANEFHDMVVSRDKLRADYERITKERNTAHKRFQDSTHEIGDLTQDIRDLKVEAVSYAKIIREQRRDVKTLMRVINKIMEA